MALADIRHTVVITLSQTHEAQREARRFLELGTDDEKVVAAGELDFLARQEAMLCNRLAEVDRRAAERKTLFSWTRQTWFGLRLSFEDWIAHG